MQLPQDGGLSCVRFFSAPVGEPLEAAALAAMDSSARLAGLLRCQCGAPSSWGLALGVERARLTCVCNGSSLPIYVGEPGPLGPTRGHVCAQGCSHRSFAVAVGIGYPGPEVPALGTLEVERAQEVVLAARCLDCGATSLAWRLRLAGPPQLRGDEPWLARIPGSERWRP